MVAFESVRAALACSVTLLRALAEHNQASDSDPLQVGIGLAAGEPVEVGPDYLGGVVNLAARLNGLAEAGQALASQAVRDLAGVVPGVAFLDLGTHALKGFKEPVRVWLVSDGQAPVA